MVTGSRPLVFKMRGTHDYRFRHTTNRVDAARAPSPLVQAFWSFAGGSSAAFGHLGRSVRALAACGKIVGA